MGKGQMLVYSYLRSVFKPRYNIGSIALRQLRDVRNFLLFTNVVEVGRACFPLEPSLADEVLLAVTSRCLSPSCRS